MVRGLISSFCILCTAWSWGAYGAVLEFNGVSRAFDSQIVHTHTHEWLKWDATLGRSVSWLNAGGAETLFGGGWRMSTTTEMATLIQQFGWLQAETLNESSSHSQRLPWQTDDVSADATLAFNAIFGTTLTQYPQNQEQRLNAMATFGSDSNHNNRYNGIQISTDYTTGYVRRPGGVWWTRDVRPENFASNALGLALVRKKTVSANQEGGFLLFILCLSLFCIYRRCDQ